MISDKITYSTLQYKHNLILGEVVNVGILFYFHEDKVFEFAHGDYTRPKLIYPSFDSNLFNAYLKEIVNTLKRDVLLFAELENRVQISDYIKSNILAPDAAGLVFCEPVTIENFFKTRVEAIQEYSKLLLPGINTGKPKLQKHNENFIIRKFNNYIFSKEPKIEEKFEKDILVKTKYFKIKFDLSWSSITQKSLKPISFDYDDESSIQNKAATFHSFFLDLKHYSEINNHKFDFLIAKPQKNDLNPVYQNAIDLLSSATNGNSLIFEDEWEKYSSNLIQELNI